MNQRKGGFSLRGCLLPILVAIAATRVPVFIEAGEDPGKRTVEAARGQFHGAARIYIIDESRCSSLPGSSHAGKCYLIEGEDNLGRLRKELSKIKNAEWTGCGCGGPDIHLYVQEATGETRYLGLDCEIALDGYRIPDSLQPLIVPSKKGFIGREIGSTYIVDVPLELDEAKVLDRVSSAGLLLLVGGGWNGFTGCLSRKYALQYHAVTTAPVHLVLRSGRIKVPLGDSLTAQGIEESFEKMRGIAESQARKWLDASQLTPLLQAPIEAVGPSGNMAEATYDVNCYLRDPDQVRARLSLDPKRRGQDISVVEVRYRSQKEVAAKGVYQAALILPETKAGEGMDQIRRLIPAVGKITTLCERGVSESEE